MKCQVEVKPWFERGKRFRLDYFRRLLAGLKVLDDVTKRALAVNHLIA
jgi:hypothetical protein